MSLESTGGWASKHVCGDCLDYTNWGGYAHPQWVAPFPGWDPELCKWMNELISITHSLLLTYYRHNVNSCFKFLVPWLLHYDELYIELWANLPSLSPIKLLLSRYFLIIATGKETKTLMHILYFWSLASLGPWILSRLVINITFLPTIGKIFKTWKLYIIIHLAWQFHRHCYGLKVPWKFMC